MKVMESPLLSYALKREATAIWTICTSNTKAKDSNAVEARIEIQRYFLYCLPARYDSIHVGLLVGDVGRPLLVISYNNNTRYMYIPA